MAELPIPTGYGVPLVNQTTKRLPDATMAAIRADVADILPEVPEPGTPVLAIVDVVTGQEARPAATHTHWMDTRATVVAADRPANMTAADVWFHPQFAGVVDPEEPEEPEEPVDPDPTGKPRHSVFPASPQQALTFHNDGGTIRVANIFYTYQTDTFGWKVVGGRVYIPAGVTLPAGTQIFLFTDLDLLTPDRTGTLTAPVAGQWNNVIFDTPFTAVAGQMFLIGYQTPSGAYLHAPQSAIGDLPVLAADGSHVAMAATPDDFAGVMRVRAWFSINGGATAEAGGAWYGADVIVEEA